MTRKSRTIRDASAESSLAEAERLRAAELYAESNRKVLEGLRSIDRKNAPGEAIRALHLLGQNYMDLRKWSQALRYAGECLALAEHEGQPVWMILALNGLGNISAYLEEFDAALDHYKSSLSLQYEHDHTQDTPTTLYNIGVIFSYLGDMEESMKYYRQSYELALEQGDQRRIMYGLTGIGNTLQQQGKHKEAIACFREAAPIAEESGQLSRATTLWMQIANAHTACREWKLAGEFYDKALDAHNRSSDKRSGLHLMLNIGNYWVLRGRLDKGEEYLKIAGELAESETTKFGRMSLYPALIDLARKKEEEENAVEYERKLEKLSREYHDEKMLGRIDALRARLEARQASHEAAMMRIKAEELEREVDARNRELTMTVMHLQQRSRMLADIRREISTALKAASSQEMTAILRQSLSELEELQVDRESWSAFTEQFKGVNPRFFEHLSRNYPNLTPMEIKICCLLQLQLSTKEIAQMLSLSTRNIENHRYRLRKKFQLDEEVNLTTFVNSIVE